MKETGGLDPLATATEVRLGRWGKENAQTKSLRLLVEGRVMVTRCGPQGVQASVRGTGHVHQVEYRPGGRWECSCPAVSERCSHVLAVAAVVVAPKGQRDG